MISRRQAALWCLVAVALTAVVTWAARALRAGSADWGDVARGMALIATRYYGPVDEARLVRAALQGAVASLGDPYSAYLTPAAYRALRGATSGQYVGVGIEVQQRAGRLPVVLRVFAGSPAASTPYQGAPAGAEPGLRAGDQLLSVDGRPLRGLPEGQVRSLLVGPQGTWLTLDVLRPTPAGGEQSLRFRLRRQQVEVQTVHWRMLPGAVGYLDIQLFGQHTPGQVRAALASLQAQGMRALVVDLRDNPGGLLPSVAAVSRLFLPGGVVAYLQLRDGARQAIAVTAPQPVRVPYAVLVDGYTASAAELLAGAVQDDHAGLLVGERTFGKGSVQEIFPLSGGAALKLTVGHYLTPSGRDLTGVGVVPDVTVPWADPAEAAMGDPATDPQLASALRRLAAAGQAA